VSCAVRIDCPKVPPIVSNPDATISIGPTFMDPRGSISANSVMFAIPNSSKPVMWVDGNGKFHVDPDRTPCALFHLLVQIVEQLSGIPIRCTPEKLAQRFHETYELLAPSFGYKTREESAKPWVDVPEQNKQLMIAVCKEILSKE
jgi:hypothetical protein